MVMVKTPVPVGTERDNETVAVTVLRGTVVVGTSVREEEDAFVTANVEQTVSSFKFAFSIVIGTALTTVFIWPLISADSWNSSS